MDDVIKKSIISERNYAAAQLNDVQNEIDLQQCYHDPLLEAKFNRINAYIDKQQEEIDNLRMIAPKHGLEQKSSFNSQSTSHNCHDEHAFDEYLRRGVGLQPANLEYKSSTLSARENDLGYSVTTKMSEQIYDSLATASVMRKLASVQKISSDALELIEERGEVISGWSKDVEEVVNNKKDFAPTKKVIVAHELYAQLHVTQRLLDDPRVNVEEWLTKKLIDVFAKKESVAFINGDGDNKPKGILSYPEGQEWGKIECVTADFNKGITIENLLSLLFSMKSQYSANAKLLMSRSVLHHIRKIKENGDRYIWTPSSDVASLNTVLGIEVIECPDMPEIQKGRTAIAFGDFAKAYQIVCKPNIKILRDPYTAKPHIKYYALTRVGGDVKNFDAVKLMKMI